MANKIADDVLRDAYAEAVHQLEARERKHALFAMFRALIRAEGWRRAILLESERADDPELIRLASERARAHFEWDQYAAVAMAYEGANGEAVEHPRRPCALDGEELDDAIRRILLERGASAYQVAELAGVETNEIANSRERKAADRAKAALLAELEADLADIERNLKIERPQRAALAKRTDGDSKRRLALLNVHERYRAELEAKVGNLSVDRKTTPKKRKSSSRKRR